MPIDIEPYELTPDDPKHRKLNPTKHTKAVAKYFNSSNTQKHLTKSKMWNIMKSIIKLRSKDNKMPKDKNKQSIRDLTKSIAWLVEVGIRIFAGIVLLTKFNGFVYVGAGLYLLGVAGVIVVTTFIDAHRK